MQTVDTKFGFEWQFVDVEIDSSGTPYVPKIEVEPKTSGNWVRVVWRLPFGYEFDPTRPVSRPGDDFEDPGFESPATDPTADPSEPFFQARRRRYGWTARNPGNKKEESYEIYLSTGKFNPNLKIVNKT